MTSGWRSQYGFSLLSVLIAMVLVSVAVVALSGTTVYVLSLHTESNVRTTAVGIAAAYMEDVKTRDVGSLASEEEVNVNEVGEANASGSFVRALSVVAGPAPKSKLVKVTVRYPRGRSSMGKVELVTIIYEGVDS